MSLDHQAARRRFLKQTGLAMLAAGLPRAARDAHAQDVVPNSAGTDPPKLKAPPHACDCHHHIYDAGRFPPAAPGGSFQTGARVEDYLLLKSRLGITRSVVVTPAPYYGNNAVTVDAVARLGGNARGVVLLRPDVADADLKLLTDAGMRGVRYSLGNPGIPTPSRIDTLEAMSKRVAPYGWHLQIYMRPEQIVAAAHFFDRIATPMVFDHMGLLGPFGGSHPAFGVLQRLLDKGRTWVKLSGAYLDSKVGADGEFVMAHTMNFAGATSVARAFIKAAPDRVVWGSDWPHPSLAKADKADDALLFDLLRLWAPDELARRRILVDNPEALYGFPKA